MRATRAALLTTGVLALVALPAVAWAQSPSIPGTVTPTPIGGWTIWQGIGAVVLGVLLIAGLIAAYVRFAPTFYGSEKRPEAAGARRIPAGARTARDLVMQQPQALASSPQPPSGPARQAAVPAGAASATQAAAAAPPRPAPQPRQDVPAKPEPQVEQKAQEQAPAKTEEDRAGEAAASGPPAGATEAEEAAAAGTEGTTPSPEQAGTAGAQPSVPQEKPSGEQQTDARGAENIVDTEAPGGVSGTGAEEPTPDQQATAEQLEEQARAEGTAQEGSERPPQAE